MKVRGQRECKECSSRWSYYETGSVTCPDCGSLRSVGVDDRTRHTDAPATLDLAPVRGQVDDVPTREVAKRAADACREYVRRRGFIAEGALQELDEVFVSAVVLRAVATELARGLQPTEDEELYFLDLLRGADEGDRPSAGDVSPRLRQAFGLAMANAIEHYQRDVRTYLEDHHDPDARALAGRIRDHRKRVEALDGDVDPEDAARLLRATRDLGRALSRGDESAYVTGDNWLSGIED